MQVLLSKIKIMQYVKTFQYLQQVQFATVRYKPAIIREKYDKIIFYPYSFASLNINSALVDSFSSIIEQYICFVSIKVRSILKVKIVKISVK